MRKIREKVIVKMIVCSAIVLIITAILVGIIGIKTAKGMVLKFTREELMVGAIQLEDELSNEYDGEWELKGEVLIKGGVEVQEELQEQLDAMHEKTKIDYTLFIGDTRRMTTLVDKDGKRMVGSNITVPDVLDVLETGTDYYSDNVKIGNKDYYGYYTPLRNPDGSIIGMVFTGRLAIDVKDDISGLVKKIVLAVIAFSAISCIIGFSLAGLISGKLNMLADSIKTISEGDLKLEVPYVLLKRPDEIGTIARAVSDMKDKLSEVIGNTKNLAEKIKASGYDLSLSASNAAEASNQVVSAVEDITKGSLSQAESVQTSNENTGQIGEDIDGCICACLEEETAAFLQIFLRQRQRRLFHHLRRHALELAAAREGDDNVFWRFFVLFRIDLDFLGLLNGGAPALGILVTDGLKFRCDHVHEHRLMRENVFKARNECLDFLVFFPECENFKVRETLETHVQNGLRLDFIQTESLHQGSACFLGGLAGADQPDDLIQVVHGNHETFQNMCPCPGLLEIIFRTAGDHMLLVLDEIMNHGLEAHLNGLAVRDGHHVHAERHLQITVFVQVCKNLLRVRVLSKLDDGTHAHPVRFIPDIVDAA